MSGGSYDYAYSRVEDMADSMDGRQPTPLRSAFAKHLRLVAKAMKAVEWVDSCDSGPGDEDEAIKAALGEWRPAVVGELRERVDALGLEIETMRALLKDASR